MIKILIVDDELLVRIGLKSTLDWEKHGYTLVGEAKNAKEAIELFEKHSPDILLTDINMPGQNGLELIRYLRTRNPHIQSIILTHYEDFNYAREAVTLGVRDYIVKSNLTSERLLNVLKLTEKHLPRSSAVRSFSGSEAGDDEDVDGLVADLFFNRSADLSPGPQDYSRIRKHFHFGGFQLALISINLNINEKKQLDEKQKQIIDEVSRQVLSENPFPVIRQVHQNQILYLFNFDPTEHPDGIGERITHFMNLLKINLKKFLNYYLLIGISRPVSDISGCGDLYPQAYEAGKRAFFEANHISQYPDTSSLPIPEKVQVDWNRVEGFLKSSRYDELGRYIDMICGEAARLKDFDYLKDNYDHFIDLAQGYLTDNRLTVPVGLFGDSGLKKDHFYNLYDIEAVKMHIVNVFNTILNSPSDDKSVENSYIIKKSIAYINAHYNQNISLSNLAQNASVSRSYLSFLFKQELGENFSHYLTNTRIDHAREMLAGTNLKIYEIADRVGFDSPYYFSKVFKEVTGETCKDYRNKHYRER